MRSLERIIDSLVTVDIGHDWTRVLLFDRVDGVHRFVAHGEAPTTVGAPHYNLMVGLRDALRQVEVSTGRTFLDVGGELISPEDSEGHGVDGFMVASSAAPPLHVAVGGLTERLSAASARRAALSTYSTITHSFALDAPGGRWGNAEGARGVVRALMRQWPDALILAGGTEERASAELWELIEAIRLAFSNVQERAMPTVIWAGNSSMGERIQEHLAQFVPVIWSDNIRPSLERERLRTTGRLLDQQFRIRQVSRLPGYELLQQWASREVIATAEALARVAQYLALRPELAEPADEEASSPQARTAMVVDVGGGSTMLAITFADRSTQTLIRTDLGLSAASSLLDVLDMDVLTAWLPASATPADAAALLLNHALYPPQYPMTEEEMRFWQGVAREVIYHTRRDAQAGWWNARIMPRIDLVLGGGGPVRSAPRAEQALALLLDAVQPTGITHFLRDRVGIAPAIGTLADLLPTAAADLMEVQGFESLGVVVTPLGRGNPGQEIMRFRLQQAEFDTEGMIEYGQLYRFPNTEETTLTVEPLGEWDIGLGPGVGTRLTRSGDAVGFVIDARGRPLPRGGSLDEQRTRAEEWMRYVGA